MVLGPKPEGFIDVGVWDCDKVSESFGRERSWKSITKIYCLIAVLSFVLVCIWFAAEMQ